MRKLLLLFLLASPLAAQTVTQPLANQTVTAGQSATFTITVSGGPCRSLWTINGAGHYGAVASTVSYTFPSVTLADNGTKVSVELYNCTGGSVTIRTSPVILTVVSAAPTLQSLQVMTPLPTIGIGQTDLLSVSGTYSDATTKDLTATATWSSGNAAVASVSTGNVLGLTSGTANITATIGSLSAATMLTVEPVINVTFTPTYDDGTVSPLVLAIVQTVTNADGTTSTAPVLQLPDPFSNSFSGSFLVNKNLSYQAQVAMNANSLPAFSMPYDPVLLLAIMPQVKSASFSVTLFKASGLVKSFTSGAQ